MERGGRDLRFVASGLVTSLGITSDRFLFLFNQHKVAEGGKEGGGGNDAEGCWGWIMVKELPL